MQNSNESSQPSTGPVDRDDDPAFDGALVRDVCRAIEAAGYPQLTIGQFANLAGALHDVLYRQQAAERDLVDGLTAVYGLGFTAGQRHGAASAQRTLPASDPVLVDRMRTLVDLVVTGRTPLLGYPITEEQRKRATTLAVALVDTVLAHGASEDDLPEPVSLAATALDTIRSADRRTSPPTTRP